MKLKKLTLTNFRCYENFEINFNEKLNVIVAENSGGKTTILDAIAIAYGAMLTRFPKVKGKTFERYFLDNPNKKVVTQLKKDQGGICCYCENSFHNQIDREGDFRVEHFHPKSDVSTSRNWNFIWTNLLGCCYGGNQNVSNPDFLHKRYILNHEDRHCDVL